MEYAKLTPSCIDRYGPSQYLPGSCPCQSSCPVPNLLLLPPLHPPSIYLPQHLYQSAALNMSILSAVAQFLDSSVSRYLNRIWRLNLSWPVISNPSHSNHLHELNLAQISQVCTFFCLDVKGYQSCIKLIHSRPPLVPIQVIRIWFIGLIVELC